MVFQLIRQVFFRRRQLEKFRAPTELSVFIVAGISVIGLTLGIRTLGALEPLEMVIYDQMVRLRPMREPDPRLLVVEITEVDVQHYKQWPFPDQVIADALKQLQTYQAKVVGLDLIRDVPNEPGRAALLQELSQPNVVVPRVMGNTAEQEVPGLASIPSDRVGFVDVTTDPDGVLRRSLMFAFDGRSTVTSFSVQAVMLYLGNRGDETANDEFQLGKATFFPLRKNSGGYQTADDSGYQILLNYRSALPPAPTISLTQLLRGDIDPALVKDRIVLIGVTAPTLKDSFLTPFSAAETISPSTPGVMIHAHMVSQYLTAATENRSLFWFWPEPLEIVWIVIWAFVGGLVAWKAQRPFVLLVAGSGLLLVLFGFSFYLFLQDGWIPVAAPALAAIALGSFAITYQVQYMRQQQETVMKLLGQQTSPEIASALWNSRDRLLQSGILTGQSLTATILFLDICSFSSISEQRSTELVMSWLNEFMWAMTQEVHAHHGIVNKFMGDGLMAVFGVPIPRISFMEITEDAQQAVACALAMSDRLQELNRDWQRRELPMIRMRVGIFTGPVMAGSLGGKNRLEYAVIGDSVNIASRLEGCEKDRQTSACRILIARETLDYLRGQFRVLPWGNLQLRGRKRPVEVYEVIGYAASRPDELGDEQ